MFGTLVNAAAIILGSLVGVFLSRGIPEKFKEIILSAVGLSVLLIGVKSSLASEDIMVVIFSMIIGAVIGEALGIERRLEECGRFLEKKIGAASGDTRSLAKGFVTASLVFCVGAMAIVGSLESGLTGNHHTLMAKWVLDGVISIVFASTMGIGVMFSAAAVFIYQGTITLLAMFLKNFLVPETIAQMSSVGGLLIVVIGLNTLKITTIKVGNLLPAIFLPLIYFIIIQSFQGL